MWERKRSDGPEEEMSGEDMGDEGRICQERKGEEGT